MILSLRSKGLTVQQSDIPEQMVHAYAYHRYQCTEPEEDSMAAALNAMPDDLLRKLCEERGYSMVKIFDVPRNTNEEFLAAVREGIANAIASTEDEE